MGIKLINIGFGNIVSANRLVIVIRISIIKSYKKERDIYRCNLWKNKL